MSDLMSFLTSPHGLLIAIITAASSWLATRQKAKSDKDISRGPEWDNFSQRQKEMMDDLRSEIDKLRQLYAQLEQKFHDAQDRYWAAVNHIRDVHLHNPHVRKNHPPPPAIADDVKL
ncbi:hypothetical protein CMUST_01300 [Corynebacterium mustelae]|uniref:Uncharacterized protein n=1 Tax=Corynebacterium mustelae TaxID=571915 RepID=A0A0G3GU31_9CORY|nr:hypothetical protein [Corynebacterium mustelae]AKK04609.1 hypothetical protein CMUST_01300 [Corynebacterium mustelae]